MALDATGEHLHLAVSDENGIMCGGHMMPGCTVRTTLELVIGELEQVTLAVSLVNTLVMRSWSSHRVNRLFAENLIDAK